MRWPSAPPRVHRPGSDSLARAEAALDELARAARRVRTCPEGRDGGRPPCAECGVVDCERHLRALERA